MLKAKLIRYCLICCLILPVAYIFMHFIDRRASAETDSEPYLEIVFSKALNNVGQEYLNNKFEIINMEETALPFLRKKEKSKFWRVRVQSQILIHSLVQKEQYNQFSVLFEKTVKNQNRLVNPFKPFLSGGPTKGMGHKEAVPFLLERLLKDRVSPYEKSIFASADNSSMDVHDREKKKYERYVGAYAGVSRIVSTYNLGEIGDQAVFEPLLYALLNYNEPALVIELSEAITKLGNYSTLEKLVELEEKEVTPENKIKLKKVIRKLNRKLEKGIEPKS